MEEHKKYNLRKDYWDNLNDKERDLYRLISPIPTPESIYTLRLDSLKRTLKDMEDDAKKSGGTFEMNPDFQRGNNCWSKEQQQSYVENLLRGIAPKEFKFNSNNWNMTNNDHPEKIVCVDGLQRLTALELFLNDELVVFGKLKASELYNTPFSPKLVMIDICMYTFEDRAELLNFYIKLNSGGTVHSKEEIQKVKNMLEDEKNKSK